MTDKTFVPDMSIKEEEAASDKDTTPPADSNHSVVINIPPEINIPRRRLHALASQPAMDGRLPVIISKPKEVWVFLRTVYAVAGMIFTCNALMGVIAKTVPEVGRSLAYPTVFSVPGSIAGLSSVMVYCRLMKFRSERNFSLFLLLLQAGSTSVLIALFNWTDFGDTLLLSSIELSVMFICLTVYSYFSVGKGYAFTYAAPFLVSTIPAILTVLIVQMFVQIKMQVWLFSVAAAIFIITSTLRKSKKMLIRHTSGEGITGGILLYGYVVRRFLGHVSFLLFQWN